MTSKPLEYWKPGSEERQLRIFISHRYDQDQALYDDVVRSLNKEGHAVQDVSLSARQVLAGPRGGELPELEIQAEIAARIYTSDILVAPSRPGVTRSEWVTWEVQLAAIGYGIPILFVDEEGLRRRTQLVSQVGSLSLKHAVCEPSTPQIVRNIIDLVGRQTWSMRHEEEAGPFRYRGPPRVAFEKVIRQFPYQPRLA
ncbi:MAG: TIR domain-containing protein [Hyphomonadaceae bacterium]